MTRDPKIRMKRSVIHREPETDSARTAETAENLTRTGSMPDGSIDPLLQFITEHGQMLGVAIACGSFWTVFHTVHGCPFRPKSVLFGETDDAGETIEPGKTLNTRVCRNRMKTSWGRSSVG